MKNNPYNEGKNQAAGGLTERGAFEMTALFELLPHGGQTVEKEAFGIPFSLAYDGVHFTEQGHRAFAAGLLEELK